MYYDDEWMVMINDGCELLIHRLTMIANVEIILMESNQWIVNTKK